MWNNSAGVNYSPNTSAEANTQMPTMQLRRRRPGGATDADIVLEQLFVSYRGERVWREIELVLED